MSITQTALQPKKQTKKQSKEKTKNNERKIKKKIKEGERDMKKEKKIALITLLVMILNMFSPYSVLFNNISKAATGVLGDNPIIINNLGVTQKGYVSLDDMVSVVGNLYKTIKIQEYTG